LLGTQKGASEYRLLVEARENLESGKSYREVRAGAGFTRKVMDGIEEQEAGRAPAINPANTIAIISAAVILGIIAIIGYFVLHGGEAGRSPIEELGNTYFITTQSASTFENSIPADWSRIGAVVLEAKNGLHPDKGEGNVFKGGGIVGVSAMPADQAFAVDVDLQINRLTDDVIAQVFVTDDRNFNPERGTSGHELVWLIQKTDNVRPATPGKEEWIASESVVLPNGRVEGTQSAHIASRQLVNVRIMVNREAAIIESGGQRQWAGAHQLDPSKLRYVGVRFLKRGSNNRESIDVESVRVLKP